MIPPEPEPEPEADTERRVPPELDRARLDRVLEALFPGRSRAAWQKAVRRGAVRLDGRAVRRSNQQVSRGQRLAVLDEQARRGAPPRSSEPEPSVLAADEAVVVLHKPAGWLTHPADRATGPDLVRFVAQRFGALPVTGTADLERAGVVHRLDRWTSGAIVFARSERALEDLRRQFRARSVTKRYLALVHGALDFESLRIDAPLRASRRQVDLQLVGEHPRAREAVTEVELLERLGPVSLVACQPLTGRRHQIRAHLASVGLPVVGDPLYRPSADERARVPARGLGLPRGRHALHAQALEFDHPATGERRRFAAELAPDLAAALATLRRGPRP